MATSVGEGDVIQVNLDPTFGAEIRKSRPAVVVSTNFINDHFPVVVVCPISGYKGKASKAFIFVPQGEGGLTKDSVVVCGQPRGLDKSRIVSVLGKLPPSRLKEVREGLRYILGI